jgi:hypothetical protein
VSYLRVETIFISFLLQCFEFTAPNQAIAHRAQNWFLVKFAKLQVKH